MRCLSEVPRLLKGRSGFTLIEIVLVIALITMVMGLSVISITAVTDTQEKPIEQLFREYVREARIQAATAKQTVYLNFDSRKGEFVLAQKDGAAMEHAMAVDDTLEPSEWIVNFYLKLTAEDSSRFDASVPVYAQEPVSQLMFHPSGVGQGAKVEFIEKAGYQNTLTLDPFSSGPDPGVFE